MLFLVCFAGEEKEMNACRLKEMIFLELFHFEELINAR